ncbi:hypothetical protein EMIHUDRAFT_434920 [Emiliania huxleyi CCMP1516]|uniref:EF-hand domain-containing protein n=2 Tax=Emiliania huxleyi TaxID=2903 RepID=A0A0D3JWI5_EMIH1|nr:hypothetical protein EMIHUDRAFT_434920 [Emiliania huxleyi CCMP1516]EOD27870.1 hypothetical protein EMIHUDRAFT_434920 [Emiliania huxleyi CCMP1516]|eukprot:XP_005780299.1 hypothetical protein EMIHUDRAFT_434920 [Emiliania huxleyi CCMP1516]
MIRQGYGTPTLAKPSKEFVKHKRQSLSPENRQSSAFSPPSRGLGRASKVPPPKSPHGGEAAIFSRSVSRGGEIAANAAESAGCNNIPGLKGMINDIFDAADTNKDGRVDIDESYVLILKLYIKVNRQAPVNPPSREVSEVLFRAADNDGSGRLNKEEFLELATTLLGRAGAPARRRVQGNHPLGGAVSGRLFGRHGLPQLRRRAGRTLGGGSAGGGGGPRPLWAASVDGLLAGLGSVLPDSAEAAVFSEGPAPRRGWCKAWRARRLPPQARRSPDHFSMELQLGVALLAPRRHTCWRGRGPSDRPHLPLRGGRPNSSGAFHLRSTPLGS